MLEGEGQITGFNGLVLGLARERGIDAICILGETDDPAVVQPRAAQRVLEYLIRMLGIKPLDMQELEEGERRKRFMEQQRTYIERFTERGETPGVA